jgi:hypothetical protein
MSDSVDVRITSDPDRDPDAYLEVKHTRQGEIVVFGWTDGRRTMTPTEHEEQHRLVRTAESRYPPEDYESGTRVASVWFDDEERVEHVRWGVDDDK